MRIIQSLECLRDRGERVAQMRGVLNFRIGVFETSIHANPVKSGVVVVLAHGIRNITDHLPRALPLQIVEVALPRERRQDTDAAEQCSRGSEEPFCRHNAPWSILTLN